MTLTRMLGRSVLPGLLAALLLTLLTPLGTPAAEAATRKVCSNGRVLLVVKGITCRKGKRLIARAEQAFWDLGEGPNRVGNYRCTYPAYLGDIRCHHVDVPRRKWVRQATE